MTFEWDIRKDRLNQRKHDGISFEMAARVFLDSKRLDVLDEAHSTETEERWNAIGMVEEILFVVYTERREERIRIISARKADKEEVDDYYRDYDAR